MGGYIRLDKDLESDPRLLALADQLMAYLTIELAEDAEEDLQKADSDSLFIGFSPTDARALLCNAMLGGLVHLWTYADMRIKTNNVLPLSRTALAQVMRLPEWVVRLYPPDWIVDIDGGNAVQLPGYVEKNGIVGHEERREDKNLQRAIWAAQKRRQRSRSRKNGMSSVHPSKVPMSAPCPPLCPPPTGTGTGTVRPYPVPSPDSASPAASPSAAAPRPKWEEEFRARFGSPTTAEVKP